MTSSTVPSCITGTPSYIRDYEIIVHVTADPRTGIPPVHLRYLFKYCVAVEVQTTVSPDTWRCSLDERLTDREIGPDLDGFVWAVRWQPLYPGAEVVADSERAVVSGLNTPVPAVTCGFLRICAAR
jgi:hypothetical protein